MVGPDRPVRPQGGVFLPRRWVDGILEDLPRTAAGLPISVGMRSRLAPPMRIAVDQYMPSAITTAHERLTRKIKARHDHALHLGGSGIARAMIRHAMAMRDSRPTCPP